MVIAARRGVIDYLELKVATDDELLGAMLGPTGNLRAPTIRRGAILYVGFNEEVWSDLRA